MSVREHIIADTHFGHAKIIEYCNRPFKDVHEMDQVMLENWNNAVGKNDKVWVLGDFAFGDRENIKERLERLNGDKILVMGNHDRRIKKNPQFWLDVGFKEVYKYPIIKDGKIGMMHEPESLEELMKLDSSMIYLFGHIHNHSGYKTITNNSACMSAERWNYTPVQLTKVLNMIANYEKYQDTTYVDRKR